MRLVIALGGNALLRRNEAPDAQTQRRNIAAAIEDSVAPLARRHDLVITHGNGPQIGLLALQAAAYHAVSPYPLDLLGAESEGMVGYLIDLALANALPGRDIASLLTQVEVDPADPAFAAPTKPIGPVYGHRATAARMPWPIMRDGGGWRRAVPSPLPQRIREIHTIRLLLDKGIIVVCAGGGGIPVVPTLGGGWRGVEAVVDKDHASALLAEAVGADLLLLLTDVSAVWTRWPMSEGTPIRRTTPQELRSFIFAAGSMGPKVDAACSFVEKTGHRAAIGAIEEAQALLDGRAGTVVEPD